MGIFSLWSASLSGIQGFSVRVEVDIAPGLPKFHVVGLGDTAVQEARERIRAAITNSGFEYPKTVITANLAPAHIKKQGSHHDLAIALGILGAQGDISCRHIDDSLIVGELALTGALRPVRGIVPIALFAKKSGKKYLFVPKENVAEASLIPNLHVFGCESLSDLVAILSQTDLSTTPLIPSVPITSGKSPQSPSLSTIQGQSLAKRALIIAAAGRHNLLFIGPPGSGKTLLAKTFPLLLPDLTFDEAIETLCIESLAHGQLDIPALTQRPPFRAPHHHASTAALIGGGSSVRPGEISAAHNGVLFLDELPEFSKSALEALRQPLESGEITVARALGTLTFPAKVQLIAAMNPCPCGHAGDAAKACVCHERIVRKYQERISGPLLDRLDLLVDIRRVPVCDLQNTAQEDLTADNAIKEQIAKARTLRQEREKGHESPFVQKSIGTIEKLSALSSEAKTLALRAVETYALSARGYSRLLRVARTIADLAESESVNDTHVAEALQFRSRILNKSLA